MLQWCMPVVARVAPVRNAGAAEIEGETFGVADHLDDVGILQVGSVISSDGDGDGGHIGGIPGVHGADKLVDQGRWHQWLVAL